MRKPIGLLGVLVIALCARSAEAAFNVTVSNGFTANGTFSGGVFTPTANSAVLNVTEMLNALAVGNVRIETGSGGAQAGNVTFSGDILTAAGSVFDLVVNAAGSIVVNSRLRLPSINITLNAGTSVSVQFEVSGRSVTIHDPLNLMGATSLNGSTNITLHGTVDGPNSLNLFAPAVALNGPVGATTPPTLVFVDGGLTLNASSITVNGFVLVQGNVVLAQDTIISSSAGIQIFGTINGGSLVLDGPTVTIADSVGDVTPLGSLEVTGTSTLSGDVIRTNGPVRFEGPVILEAPIAIDAQTGIVNFASTLDGAHALSLSALGVIFGGTVGTTTPPAAIDAAVDPSTGSVVIMTTAITVGDSFNTLGSMFLLSNVTIRTANPGGHIEFQGAINGALGLVLNSSTARFAAPVGVSNPLASVSTVAATITDLDGGTINTTNGMFFNGRVNLGAAAILNASNPGASIIFGGLLSGDHNLTVNASITRFLSIAIGSPDPLGVVTLSGQVEFLANMTVKSQQVRFNGGLDSVFGIGRTLAFSSPYPEMTIGLIGYIDRDSQRALANGFSQLTFGDAGTQFIIIGQTVWEDPVVFRANASGGLGTGEVVVAGSLTRIGNATFTFDTRTLELRDELLPGTVPPYYVQSATVPAGLPPVTLISPTYWKVNASAGVLAGTLELLVCRVPRTPGAPRYWDGAQWRPVAFVDSGGCPLITLTTASVPPLSAAATDLHFAVGGFLFDPNGDSLVTITDAFYLVNFLFAGGPAPIGSGDADGSGAVNVLDVFYVLHYLFAAGPPPV